MKTKSADGVSISYQSTGSGNPALVFVHGWCCDKNYWDSQVSHFAKTYQVVTLDLAGHGDSGTDRENWNMAAFGEDVAAVIKQLSLKQVVLIGHSMGGHVVVEVPRLLPECIIGVVGVDAYRDLNYKTIRESYNELLARLHADFNKASREFVTSMFLETSDPSLVEKIVSNMGSTPPRVAIGALEGVVNQDLAGEIRKIRVPIRCICSHWRPFDLETAKQLIPFFEVKFISGVGHFLMLEDPGTFNSLLEEIIIDFVS